MYLFTRNRRIRPGSFAKGVDWAVAATELAKKVTGREMNGWLAVMSPETGTVTWSLWSESVADIVEAGDKLATSASFEDLVERGDAYFEGPMVDGLAQLVYGAPDPNTDPPDFVSVVIGAAAPGRLGDAITAGAEIAAHVSKVVEQPALFAMNATGVFGGLAWIVPAPDVTAVDAGRAALLADPDWLTLMDRVGSAYQPGAAQTMFRRIA